MFCLYFARKAKYHVSYELRSCYTNLLFNPPSNSQITHSHSSIHPSGTRVCNQLGKIRARSSAKDNIRRLSDQFHLDNNQETEVAGMLTTVKEGNHFLQSGFVYRSGKFHNSSCMPMQLLCGTEIS